MILRKIYILLLFGLVALQGYCSDLDKLVDKKWVLMELGVEGMETQDLSHKKFFMIFHPNREITFHLDTNPGKLRLESLGNSRISYKFFKSEELVYNGRVAEKIYQCISKAEKYILREDSLILTSDYGYILFMSMPFPDSGLTGTWVLSAYENKDSAESIKPPAKIKRPVKIHFNDDGTMGSFWGQSEENDFTGRYELTDTNRLSILKISEAKKHEPNVWSEKFWEVIKFSSLFHIDRDTLLLYFNVDKEYMEFLREEEGDEP